MTQHNTCPVCGGNTEHVKIEGMVQYKCPYCGYIDIPRELMNNEAAAASQKFKFLTIANNLYAEILNKIATPTKINWPDKLLGEDVSTFLNTPIYGMLYVAWLTKGFRTAMTPQIKAVIQAVYEPASMLKSKSVVLAVLINLYENSLNEEQLGKAKKKKRARLIAIASAAVVTLGLIAGALKLASYAPTLTDEETGASVHLTKDSVSMFDKLGLTLDVEEHPEASAHYVNVKRALKYEVETFSVYKISLTKNEEARSISSNAIFTLPIPYGYDTTCLCVYYLDSNNTFSIVPSTVSISANTVTFTENRLGTYVLAERQPIVSFDSLGGTQVYPDIVKKDTLAEKPTDPTRDGYEFLYWTYNGSEWKFDKNTVTDDMTLVASWKPLQYTVSFNANGGTLDATSQTLTFDAPYTLPTPERVGYKFDGWAYNNQRFTVGEAWKIPDDVVLEAQWSLKTCTVSFDSNGGAPVDDVSVTYSLSYTLPEAKRSGFVFMGWYYNGEKCDGTSWMIDSDSVTLIAHWEAGDIVFDANGGTVDVTSKLVPNSGTYGALPTPQKGNHAFMGWYTAPDGGTKITADSTVDFDGSSVTLYAHWTPTAQTITLGNGQADRHAIRLWNSWGHSDDWHGKDEITTNLNRDELLSLGYTKIKVTMTFYYRVDDWGDQLIQIFSTTGKEVTRFQYEWDERGWTQQTVEYELSLSSHVDSKCGFWIKWYLFKDGNNSDTWFVGGTTLSITAVK